ncbi:hypothetical protein Tco_1365613, partial [Tanacetum coccineum]
YAQALKSFLNGPSVRSFATSVKARNLLKPVVAAPLPRAATLVSTSSLDARSALEVMTPLAHLRYLITTDPSNMDQSMS